MFKFFKRDDQQIISMNDAVLDRDINYLLDYMDEAKYADQFSTLLKVVFEHGQYEVTVTDGYQDAGIDMILSKKSERVGVQLKQHSVFRNTLEIDLKMIKEFKGSLVAQGFDEGYYITTHYFTKQAIDFARENNVKLFDREGLFKLIGQYYPQLLVKFAYKSSLNGLLKCKQENCSGNMIKLYSKKYKKLYYKCVVCGKTRNS